MEKTPLGEIWKGLKKLEVKACGTVPKHIASLVNRAELEEVIINDIFSQRFKVRVVKH